jgi:hypothetical protein
MQQGLERQPDVMAVAVEPDSGGLIAKDPAWPMRNTSAITYAKAVSPPGCHNTYKTHIFNNNLETI